MNVPSGLGKGRGNIEICFSLSGINHHRDFKIMVFLKASVVIVKRKYFVADFDDDRCFLNSNQDGQLGKNRLVHFYVLEVCPCF